MNRKFKVAELRLSFRAERGTSAMVVGIAEILHFVQDDRTVALLFRV